MADLKFFNGVLLTPAVRMDAGELRVSGGRIADVGRSLGPAQASIDLQGDYLVPGLIDLHVHGGDGADFMDGTSAAYRTVCRCHARHGTTSLLPTSTAADDEYIDRFLRCCRQLRGTAEGGARILGAHFYGPYFSAQARGCHPAQPIRPPESREFSRYLEFAESICTATIAPELPQAAEFAAACRDRQVRLNAGHSHATFEQMEQAVGWGVRHVDHLFCAMSDRAKLRQSRMFPMGGGVMEATLYFDELTTEVIADGAHLDGSLLRLAYKIKGPERLALVTDAMRAVDCPDGEYFFGPAEHGEIVRRCDNVGVTRDGATLASGVMGLDHGVRTFARLVPEATLCDVVRMATLTPARIAGYGDQIGSLEPGKRADLVVLDRELNVRRVFIDGHELNFRSN